MRWVGSRGLLVAGSGHTRLDVRLVMGEDAFRLLSDCAFVQAWDGLHRDCTWATPFQGVAFASTWYRTYQARYRPLIVYAGDAENGLAGLLLLAVSADSAEVAHVGTFHAEYHAWLARASTGKSFILQALRALRDQQFATRLQFLFVAPGTPLDWVDDAADLGIRCSVRWHQRGLLYVGSDSHIAASLRKSGNKSRLSRLRRHGPVEIKQLTTARELDAVIPTIAVQCDVRQGAAHGSLPFRSDPDKHALYRAMQSQPGLLHSTVLLAGERVVAAHIGAQARRSVHLGLITHDPSFGAYSPGKLLLLQLARMLHQQGFEWFDLTPGGAYKDRLASNYDRVAVVEIFFSRGKYVRHRTRRTAVAALRKAEKWTGKDLVGISSRVMAHGVRALRRPGHAIRVAAAMSGRWVRALDEFRYYEWDAARPVRVDYHVRLRVNEIKDFLYYAGGTGSDLTTFLATTVERLEDGQLAWTAVGEEQLLHYGWLIPCASEVGSDFGHRVALREPRAVLWDDFTFPSFRQRGLHYASLLARLHYVSENGLAPGTIIGVRADNAPSRHNIEKVGFKYCGSAWAETRLGRRRRWLTVTSPSVLESLSGESADRS